ncbi:Glycerol-3-phosphate dehydrogenase [NAD(P)+] [Tetrabaena socialis]|uniref:Glycerol-3-phosphate dehydrogenase [NAD(P)+] n=1 Tax=Tetrabaena socialis TaxID=47790 RepID=A0A2J7ZZP8_9CHLO|nr:Glycerol-3-phosphate dehydrogenase [NAD(P)+] [Tetrabaena socialis]|eukprot:PNH05726.1 Glycerol-3-phosphate dehydrogenase [NAD(P)+] [Tetrabaena socialis]
MEVERTTGVLAAERLSDVLRAASSGPVAHLLAAPQILVSCSKGIGLDSLETVAGLLQRLVPPPFAPRLAFLSGPSFAAEVAAGLPTAVTVAAKGADAVEVVTEVMSRELKPEVGLDVLRGVVTVATATGSGRTAATEVTVAVTAASASSAAAGCAAGGGGGGGGGGGKEGGDGGSSGAGGRRRGEEALRLLAAAAAGAAAATAVLLRLRGR